MFGGKCYTVFSASNYCNQAGNKGHTGARGLSPYIYLAHVAKRRNLYKSTCNNFFYFFNRRYCGSLTWPCLVLAQICAIYGCKGHICLQLRSFFSFDYGMCVCVYSCLSVSVALCLLVPMCLCLSLCLCISLWLYISVSLHVCVVCSRSKPLAKRWCPWFLQFLRSWLIA